jgi:uncharacterized membrane protein
MAQVSHDGTLNSARPNTVTDESISDQFQYRITPHRSLSDFGFFAVVGSVLGIAAAIQIYFFFVGVWFAGVVALFNALFLSAAFIACRADRNRSETISYESGTIDIVRRNGNGAEVYHLRIPIFGVELVRTIDPDYGMRKLELCQSGKLVEVASDLSPIEREAFLRAFAHSLAEQHLTVRVRDRHQSAHHPPHFGIT